MLAFVLLDYSRLLADAVVAIMPSSPDCASKGILFSSCLVLSFVHLSGQILLSRCLVEQSR